VPAGKIPIGYEFECEFVPACMCVDLILNPTSFFSCIKILYPCPQTRVPAIACVYIYIYIYIYIYMCVCVCVFIYIYTYIFVYVYLYVCMYI
jgi:hypothetical protein